MRLVTTFLLLGLGCGFRSINVSDENLARAVRPANRPTEFNRQRFKVFDPRLEVVRLQGKMITAVVRYHWSFASTDDVQFL